MRLLHASLIAGSAFTLGGQASAHIQLDSPPSRYSGQVDQKTKYCGSGGTASGVVTEWTAGTEVTVSWTETINHPGHFRIALDPTGTDLFEDPVDENDKLASGNIIAYIDDPGGQSNFSYTFTVPDYDCNPCSLQVIQYMTDKLNDGIDNEIYYWCADVQIAGGGSGTTTTTTTTGGAGGGGQGGEGAGGVEETSSTGSAQYPNFARESTGCSLGAPAGRFGGLGGLALLAGACLMRRRRD